MRWAAIALAVAAIVAGCGGDDEPASSGQPAKQPLIVSAAASLKDAFTGYGESFPDADVKLSFAGSDELAAQIRQGVKPDVFAAANTKLPDELYADGLVEKPAVFAGNELVLAVPASGSKIGSLDDLAASGVKLAIGAEGVPVGAYTRKVLDALPAAQKSAILGNVRSNEPDVKGVVGKLTQGAVDAGFVYRSDVRAADDELTAIALPAELKPEVAYGVAVVKGAKHPEQAHAFVQGLLNGEGAKALEAAGFLPPPTS
jgi:molybdate transport system substrate-binding protein